MSLSQQSIDALIDLVEIKLSCMQVLDREDAREHAALEQCLGELRTLFQKAVDGTVVQLVADGGKRRRRGTRVAV